MHDLIFENQNSLSEQMLGELAHRLTLDRQALRDALKSGTFAERVQGDFSSGVRSGVNGTPTFFINGRRHDGDFELETLLQTASQEVRNESPRSND
jgi:predicted DsbA family dithiol-disulfide isomerase